MKEDSVYRAIFDSVFSNDAIYPMSEQDEKADAIETARNVFKHITTKTLKYVYFALASELYNRGESKCITDFEVQMRGEDR